MDGWMDYILYIKGDLIMKIMSPLGYHHNGIVETHVNGHMMHAVKNSTITIPHMYINSNITVLHLR